MNSQTIENYQEGIKIAWMIGYLEHLYRNNRARWIEVFTEFQQMSGLSRNDIVELVDILNLFAINISRMRPLILREDIDPKKMGDNLLKITFMNLNQVSYARGIGGSIPDFTHLYI